MEEEEIVKGAQAIGAVLRVLGFGVAVALVAAAVWLWHRVF